jgi:hypothetical protein
MRQNILNLGGGIISGGKIWRIKTETVASNVRTITYQVVDDWQNNSIIQEITADYSFEPNNTIINVVDSQAALIHNAEYNRLELYVTPCRDTTNGIHLYMSFIDPTNVSPQAIADSSLTFTPAGYTIFATCGYTDNTTFKRYNGAKIGENYFIPSRKFLTPDMTNITQTGGAYTTLYYQTDVMYNILDIHYGSNNGGSSTSQEVLIPIVTSSKNTFATAAQQNLLLCKASQILSALDLPSPVTKNETDVLKVTYSYEV